MTAVAEVPAGRAGGERGLPALVRQSAALAARNVANAADGGAIVTLIVFPPIFVFGFLALFGRIFDRQGIDYAQFLPPAIVVQWMFSVAISAAFAFAADRRDGLVARCRAMPIHRRAMLTARLAAETVRALVALAVILVCAYVAGFRLQGGVAQSAGFVVLAVAFGLVLSVGTSALGLASTDPEATASTLHSAYIPLLMVSTAFVPASGFPDWIEWFVRVQPVSQVIDALRDLAAGAATAAGLWPAAAWLLGLLAVFAWAADRAERSVV